MSLLVFLPFVVFLTCSTYCTVQIVCINLIEVLSVFRLLNFVIKSSISDLQKVLTVVRCLHFFSIPGFTLFVFLLNIYDSSLTTLGFCSLSEFSSVSSFCKVEVSSLYSDFRRRVVFITFDVLSPNCRRSMSFLYRWLGLKMKITSSLF